MSTDPDFETIPGWQDLRSAGQVPPAAPEVLARARAQFPTTTSPHTTQLVTLTRGAPAADRRRRLVKRQLVPLLAVAAVMAAGAVVAVQRGGSDQPVVTGPPSSSPVPADPSPAPSKGRPIGDPHGSCVSGPTPAWFRTMAFGFDGIVRRVEERPWTAPRYWLTFEVREWFRRPAGIRTVTVGTDAAGPEDGPSDAEYGPAFKVGQRYLVTGMEQYKGTGRWVAWTCGFSREYSPADAATWRELYK